jgi:membrane dipeptidase
MPATDPLHTGDVASGEMPTRLTESPLPHDPLHDRPNRGFHPLIEKDQPYVFVDGCMQIWPDADLANAHRHGCDVFAVTAMHPGVGVDASLSELMAWHGVARRYPNLRIAYTVDDIREAKASGQACLLLAAQDGEFIGTAPERVEAFQRLGLRMLIPAYNRDNLLCGGVLEYTDAGVSAAGRVVVQECDRVGVVLDLSHVSRRSSLEITELSANPTVFSHANPKALVDNARNIDDEQIKAVAAKGGVIGTVNWGPLVFRQGMTERPTVNDYLDHIDYLADLLGTTENIGIGTDFSLGSYPRHNYDQSGMHYRTVMSEMNKYVTTYWRAPERFVDGFAWYPEIVDVYELLRQRGYSETDIEGIAGGNFLRVFAQVWPGRG